VNQYSQPCRAPGAEVFGVVKDAENRVEHAHSNKWQGCCDREEHSALSGPDEALLAETMSCDEDLDHKDGQEEHDTSFEFGEPCGLIRSTVAEDIGATDNAQDETGQDWQSEKPEDSVWYATALQALFGAAQEAQGCADDGGQPKVVDIGGSDYAGGWMVDGDDREDGANDSEKTDQDEKSPAK